MSLEIGYGDQTLMRWPFSSWRIVETRPPKIRRVMAWDFIRRRPTHIVPIVAGDVQWLNSSVLRVTLRSARHLALTLTLTTIEPWHTVIEVQTEYPDALLEIVWQTPAAESWKGFGEHTHSIHPPARFDSWVEEGPVGLGRWSRWLKFLPFVPFPKGPYASYASVPLWLSSAGYSAWFESTEMIRWHLQSTWRRAQIWSHQTTLHVVAGKDPEQVMTRQFAVLQRPPQPPAWIFAPWNDSVQGQAEAQALSRFLRNKRIPSSAIWIEDWMGSQQNARRFWMRPLTHQPDQSLYPNFPALSHQLHSTGFKMLGYFCPEVTEGTPLYQQALKDHMLVQDASGLPVRIPILGIAHGELDLTHPNAQSWISTHLFEPARQLGFDGWMADFGEYLPVNAIMADKTTGWHTHNRYPLLWQQINRTFWDNARPSGDYTFFVRSAWVGTHRLAPVMWGGDSDTDFEEADGLPTVIPQVLSAQVAGFFYWATDIAGYMTFGLTKPSGRLLYWRWLQLAALLPVMRTHHGTARPRNWHFTKDEETLEVYTRYTRLHTALYPYFHHLAVQATQVGLPLVRPMYMVFPTDPVSWTLDQQFMLGSDLLVIPVTKRSSKQHRLYFPTGSWRCWWTNTIYTGPQWISAAIPDDRLPLYVRLGATLPLMEGVEIADEVMEGIVDSFIPIGQGPGTDLPHALEYLTLYMSCGDDPTTGEWALPSGGTLVWQYQPRAGSLCPMDDSIAMPVYATHLPKGTHSAVKVRLNPGSRCQFAAFEGAVVLSLHGAVTPLTCIVRLWHDKKGDSRDGYSA
ncbi:TIM-barrel domain-containing protein [Sulfobacillus sp. hq2]|uniref:TIM-barrel domain-containing protein n=2 Tax=Sulfobacillus TaxID=28033 RepID=UPI001304B5F9|nr:TIM-barrel domain-containing protein [Sulfobacillus sp. hq2]